MACFGNFNVSQGEIDGKWINKDETAAEYTARRAATAHQTGGLTYLRKVPKLEWKVTQIVRSDSPGSSEK